MKDELIKLSREKGFETVNPLDSEIILGFSYYLWMCELHRWLREKHGLYAYIDYTNHEVVLCDFKNSDGEELIREDTTLFIGDYDKDEEIIEKLLLESLKLIKE